MRHLTLFGAMLSDIGLITSSTYLIWRSPTNPLVWLVGVLVFCHWANTGGFDMWTKKGWRTFMRNWKERDY